MSTLLSAVLPADTPGLAAAELYADPPQLAPLPEEEPLIARSVAKRRNEFVTVRHCAREALSRLGLPPVPILEGGEGRAVLAARRGGQPDPLRGLPRRRG
ncbi:putative phosphopantetheinyl transferase, PptII, partial [Mycolicibacterium hassiacum DSM 44199]